jgi:hypothetical protein
MDTFKQGINLNAEINGNPIKRNMEEGQFSLMRKVFRESAKSTHRNNAGSTLNLSFQDNSSYIARKKALAIGKQEYNPIVSYRSYDPVYVNHVIRKQHSSGSVAPKKKGLIL